MRHTRNIELCFSPAPRWIQEGFFLQGVNFATLTGVNFFLAIRWTGPM
jgi:hypothetical protein